MIEIGGFHIKPEPFPDNLGEILDNATIGAIYFSMGTNVDIRMLGNKVMEGILKALGQRKEKVVWKYGDDSLPGKPDNVEIRRWLPQRAILGNYFCL